MAKEALKKLSDCLLEIIECESSVHSLPEHLNEFICNEYKNFEKIKRDFSLHYNEIELYVTTIFNKFINIKIADKNYSLLNISKDSLYDVFLLIKEKYQDLMANEQGITDDTSKSKIPFIIENELYIIINIFVQKVETFHLVN